MLYHILTCWISYRKSESFRLNKDLDVRDAMLRGFINSVRQILLFKHGVIFCQNNYTTISPKFEKPEYTVYCAKCFVYLVLNSAYFSSNCTVSKNAFNSVFMLTLSTMPQCLFLSWVLSPLSLASSFLLFNDFHPNSCCFFVRWLLLLLLNCCLEARKPINKTRWDWSVWHFGRSFLLHSPNFLYLAS